MESVSLLESGDFKLYFNEEKSTLEIDLNGLYTGKFKEEFEKKLNECLQNINSSESIVVIECHDNVTFSAAMLPLLEECMKICGDFKRTYILNAVNCICKLQFEKVIKNLGISHKFKYVESKDEIII